MRGFRKAWTGLVGLSLLLAPATAAWAQVGGGVASGILGSPATVSGEPKTVRGRVVNGLDGSGVARALVTMNSRTTLTDSEGRFEFLSVSDNQAFASVTRPGYNSGDGAPTYSRQRIADLTAPLELKVYPNAVISGTLTGADGAPVVRATVSLRQANFDQGSVRWLPLHNAQTNSRGEYRFSVPGGRFQLTVQSTGRSPDTGEIMLPLSYPDKSSSEGVDYFEVRNGEDRHLDLRVRTSPAYQVAVRTDGGLEAQRGVQFTLTDSSGETFMAAPAGFAQGQETLWMPAGSYLLRGRLQDRENLMEGTAKVTVPRAEPVTVHLLPGANIPIELVTDVSNAGQQPTGVSGVGLRLPNQQPNPMQLNIRLKSLDGSGVLIGQDEAYPRQDQNHQFTFMVAPGRYRLIAGDSGVWHITSASYGVSNLVNSDLVVGSGSSSTPIRLYLSNLFGTVNVSVPTLTGNAWVYMVPKGPSVATINPVPFNAVSGQKATASVRVPAGSYSVVVLDHRLQDDIRSPEVLARISGAQSVDVSANTAANVTMAVCTERNQ